MKFDINTLNCIDTFTLVFLQKYKNELSILKSVSVLKYSGFWCWCINLAFQVLLLIYTSLYSSVPQRVSQYNS